MGWAKVSRLAAKRVDEPSGLPVTVDAVLMTSAACDVEATSKLAAATNRTPTQTINRPLNA